MPARSAAPVSVLTMLPPFAARPSVEPRNDRVRPDGHGSPLHIVRVDRVAARQHRVTTTPAARG
ncbi:hypothetical protein SCOCK_110174 [Actinacidiphila cocklensis]|uniref:Uncharacterized protein n=1 Tax=Actinacidiphila cocklensis TaxID=887465 RepID=A0A9W4DJV6_9ACTN|nr:hypothetical protein SCOCK_110174 [Actinacidiphila cocklensis]